MRITIVIFALILTQTVKGQDNLTDLKSFIDTIKNIERISTIKTVKFDSLSILTTFNELSRKIDFKYEHHRILIMPYSGWDLKLNLISKNGIIEFGWISEFDPHKEKHRKILTSIKNPNFIKDYVSKHNEFYKVNLTESDFEEQILAEYVVGFGCGIVGMDVPNESKKTLRFAKNNNRKALKKYLTSFSPELQTLGTIGLFKISKLSNDQKRIIRHLKNRNSVIYSCSGCLYGIGETYNERIEYYE